MNNWLYQFKSSISLFNTNDKFKYFLILCSQTVLSLLDLIGVAMAGVLGSLVIAGSTNTKAGDRVTMVIKILGLDNKSVQTQTFIIAGFILIVFTVKIISSMFLNWKVLNFTYVRSAQLSKELFSKFIYQPLNVLNQKSLQERIFVITNTTSSISSTLSAYSIFIADIFLCFILVFGLIYVDIKLTIYIVLLFTFLIISMHFRFRTNIFRYGQIRTLTNVKANNLISEVIHGYREIQASGRRSNFVFEIGSLLAKSGKNEANIAFIPLVNKYIIEVSMYMAIFLMAWIKFSTSSSTNTGAVLTIFIVAVTRIVPALLRIQQGVLALRASLGVTEETFRFINQIKKLPTPRLYKANFKKFDNELKPHIKISNLSFQYDLGSFELNIPHLDIAFGDFVALVGRSGSGKSTLVDLILGVLRPTNGIIEILDLQPQELVQKYPGLVAYVPQSPHIFNGTIRENLTFGLINERIPDDLLWNSLRKSNLTEFIHEHNFNLDSHLGEKGNRWSGGQRQRLALARSLITRPKILVLDEFTSSLDTQTEFDLLDLIRDLAGKTTVIVVAHRLSTAKEAPKLIYMEKGKIKNVGNFNTLRAINKEFDFQAMLSGHTKEKTKEL